MHALQPTLCIHEPHSITSRTLTHLVLEFWPHISACHNSDIHILIAVNWAAACSAIMQPHAISACTCMHACTTMRLSVYMHACTATLTLYSSFTGAAPALLNLPCDDAIDARASGARAVRHRPSAARTAMLQLNPKWCSLHLN